MSWKILTYGPFYKAIALLAVVNLILSVWFLVKLATQNDRENLVGMDHGINIILLLCFVMIFFTFIDPFYDMLRAYSSVASARTGDPIIMIHGIIDVMFPINFYLTIASFYLIVWFLLRAYHRGKIERVEKNENSRVLD